MSTREYNKNLDMAYPGRNSVTYQKTEIRGDQSLPQTFKRCEKYIFFHTREKINVKDVKESRPSSN